MLPRWHILFGAIFAILVWLLFKVSFQGAVLIFFASVFFDFDHYLIYAYHKRKIGLFGVLKYYDKIGKREMEWVREKTGQKSHIQIFHTVEFHLLVLILAFYFPILYFILIGMVFHSLLDVVWLTYHGAMSLRWFFFSEWIFVKRSLRRKFYIRHF